MSALVVPIDREVSEALEAARGLVALGVPVFVAHAWPDAPADRLPFHLPGGWQHTTPDASAVDAWRPGDALCAVMGHGLDLVDIDPRNAGDADPMVTLTEAGEVPEVLARASTPSGGEHLFVRSLGVTSVTGLLPGLDIKAGAPNGDGRGFAFLAPTVRASRVTGEFRSYRWTATPPESLAAHPPHTEPALALARRIRASRAEPPAPSTATSAAELFASVSVARTEHTGPIPEGARHSALVSYAGYLRTRGVALDLAEPLMLARLGDCAQPPAARYPVTEAEALGKLHDVYRRYEGGTPDLAPVVLDAEGQPVNSIEADLLGDTELDQLPEPEPLVPGMLNRGTYVVLYAEPKAGKSFLALDWAESVARGCEWYGRECGAESVLWVAAEGLNSMKVRKPAWRQARGFGPTDRFKVLRRSVPLDSPTAVAELAATVSKLDIGLVVIDTWADSLGAADEDKSSQTRPIHKAIRETLLPATREGRGVVLVLAHTRKAEGRNGLGELRGSSAFTGAVDSAILLDPQGDGRVLIRHTHSRDTTGAEPVAFRLVPAGPSAVPEYEGLVAADLYGNGNDRKARQAGERTEAVVAVVRQHQDVPGQRVGRAFIARVTGFKDGTLRGYLKDLVQWGRLEAHGAGAGTYYRLPADEM